MNRVLTKKFMSFTVAKWERQHKKGVMDLLDVGEFELNKIANIIVLGNTRGKNETEEDVYERAYEKIDSFLEVEDNSIIDLFMQLMREFDMDFKIFKAMGMSVDDLEEELKSGVKNRVDNVKDNIKSAEQFDNIEAVGENVIQLV